MTIGEAVREARKAKGYTQDQLSEHSGISIVHISNIERDESSPTFEVLMPIAVALNLSIDDVIYTCEKEDSELFRAVVRRLRGWSDLELKMLLAAADAKVENSH